MAASNEGGLKEAVLWLTALAPRSGWDPESRAVDDASRLLDLLDS